MDPDLPSYLSGGYFAGSPDAIPLHIHDTPEAALLAGPAGRQLLGLWLHPDDADLLLEEEAPLPPARRPAVQQWLQRARALGGSDVPPSDVLGYQLIGFEEDRIWTWAEVDLVPSASEVDAVADDHGLIIDRRAAEAAARFLNCEDLGPPVIWRPWLVTRHRPPLGGV